MRSTNYPRVSRAVFCSALLLSQHAVVDANNWATGRSRRSSTLAVMQPGGRNRPIRDWKAIKRDSEEKLAKQAEEQARQAGELVEAVEDKVEEVVTESIDQLETASTDLLGLEDGTPESLGVMLAKVAAIATVGVYGAKKAVEFAKAFMKARKEASEESAGELSAVATNDEGGEDQGGDEKETEADGGKEEEGNATVEEEQEDGEVTDGFITADEEEEDASQGASAMLGSMGEAAKDMKKRTKSSLEDLKTKTKSSLEDLKTGLGEATKRGDDGDGDADGAGESGDLRAHLPKGVDGGKVDVSYV